MHEFAKWVGHIECIEQQIRGTILGLKMVENAAASP